MWVQANPSSSGSPLPVAIVGEPSAESDAAIARYLERFLAADHPGTSWTRRAAEGGGMSARDELLTAIEAGDHTAVQRRGWGEVWELLATANAPRQGCTLNELKPYAKLLGNEDPAVILEALEACAGEFRPTAGELRSYLNRRRGEGHRVDVARGQNPFLTDRAITAVADALKAGEQPCRCGGFQSSRFHHDGPLKGPDGKSKGRPTLGVLRCRTCHGLESGQLHEAEDAGLLEAVAA